MGRVAERPSALVKCVKLDGTRIHGRLARGNAYFRRNVRFVKMRTPRALAALSFAFMCYAIVRSTFAVNLCRGGVICVCDITFYRWLGVY